MKRMHVHINVNDLEASIRFYENLYGAKATVRKDDYAKWVLEDPRVNFAISQRGQTVAAISHLGIEVESADELEDYNSRLQTGNIADNGQRQTSIEEDKGAQCCYALSDKYWAADPDGVTWEFFHTTGSSKTYGEDRNQAACCS